MSHKIALITGASSGIGEQIARVLIARNWRVVGIARSTEKLDALHKELGESFIPIVCDVGDTFEIKHVSSQLQAQSIHPTLFFLNAGYGEFEPTGIDISIQKHTFDVNYFGALAWIEEWLPICLKTHATFVGISSITALCPTPQSTAYCASKAALKSSFDALRIQYHGSNISFITVLPGPVQTSMLKSQKTIPFSISAPHAAAYIVKNVLSQKHETIIFPFFYKILFKLLPKLPTKMIRKILGS